MAHTSKTATLRALILDDDPAASEVLRFRLRQSFPEIEVDRSIHPYLSSHADLYFFDNSFGGQKMVISLVRQARLMNPGALIILYSGDLDAQTLCDAVNSGCDGVWDKSQPQHFAAVADLVGEFVRRHGRARSRSIRGTLESISGLLERWNQRLTSRQLQEVQG